MSYHEQLDAEINTRLDELIHAELPLQASWITHEICDDHMIGLARNEHAEFWRHGGYKTCRDMVRRCINKRAGMPDEMEKQPTLPGFEHLQTYYIVTRGDDQLGIHRDQLSDDELDAKAAEYENMGAACISHARELRRFKNWRREQMQVVSVSVPA